MRQYFGNAGHFIGSESCRFHLTTLVGDYIISTVGDYHPLGAEDQEPHDIGLSRKFETMVFHAGPICECGCGMPTHNGRDLDFAGYNTRNHANEGHEAMCAKYESMPVSIGAEIVYP